MCEFQKAMSGIAQGLFNVLGEYSAEFELPLVVVYLRLLEMFSSQGFRSFGLREI